MRHNPQMARRTTHVPRPLRIAPAASALRDAPAVAVIEGPRHALVSYMERAARQDCPVVVRMLPPKAKT